MASYQSCYEYIDINVETMRFDEVKMFLSESAEYDALITKIDCKNRTDYMFMEFLEIFSQYTKNYHLACEHDGSSDRDVSMYAASHDGVLTKSMIVGN